jgi:hypothetical protein
MIHYKQTKEVCSAPISSHNPANIFAIKHCYDVVENVYDFF